MTNEQKIILLNIQHEIVNINKRLFELSAKLTREDLMPIIKTVQKLHQAGDIINKIF